MHAEVDKDTCIGCGACPDICPEVFKKLSRKGFVDNIGIYIYRKIY